MKELAKKTIERLVEEVRLDLNVEQIQQLIESILINTYEQSEGHESELLEELFLLFDKMAFYLARANANNLNVDKLDVEDCNLLALAKVLQEKGLLEVPQTANMMFYISAQKNYFIKKYFPEPVPPEEGKFLSGLLRYLFNEGHTFFPFFDLPGTSVPSKSWYKEAFLAQIKKYTVPLNYIAQFIWHGVRSILSIIKLPLNLFQFLTNSFKYLWTKIANFITGGMYKKQLLSYLKDTGIGRELMSSLKNKTLCALFDTLNVQKKLHSIDIKAEAEWLVCLSKVDVLEGEEFFNFIQKHFQSSSASKEKGFAAHEFLVSGWPNLKVLGVSYYQAITRPLSELQGAGNKFLSILIRPVQFLSALVIIPVAVVFELAQFINLVAQRLFSGVLTGFCLISLAVFIGPIELLDRGLKKIRNQEKPASPSPSNEPILKDLAQTEFKKEEVPGHFNSPINSAPLQKRSEPPEEEKSPSPRF